jgi:hypothetical protein
MPYFVVGFDGFWRTRMVIRTCLSYRRELSHRARSHGLDAIVFEQVLARGGWRFRFPEWLDRAGSAGAVVRERQGVGRFVLLQLGVGREETQVFELGDTEARAAEALDAGASSGAVAYLHWARSRTISESLEASGLEGVGLRQNAVGQLSRLTLNDHAHGYAALVWDDEAVVLMQLGRDLDAARTEIERSGAAVATGRNGLSDLVVDREDDGT